MKKTINILSIFSMIISVAASIISIAMLTIFWKPASSIYYSSMEIIESGPILPIGNMLYILGCLTVSLIIIFSYKSKKFIAIEVTSMILISVVLPLATWVLSLVQQSNVNYLGDSAVARLVMANKAIVLPLALVKLSSAINLVTCGMRVANKICYNISNQNFMNEL